MVKLSLKGLNWNSIWVLKESEQFFDIYFECLRVRVWYNKWTENALKIDQAN